MEEQSPTQTQQQQHSAIPGPTGHQAALSPAEQSNS
ncbi:hypothetical protein MRX96_031213, partial [Rhipicephalus microplus]